MIHIKRIGEMAIKNFDYNRQMEKICKNIESEYAKDLYEIRLRIRQGCTENEIYRVLNRLSFGNFEIGKCDEHGMIISYKNADDTVHILFGVYYDGGMTIGVDVNKTPQKSKDATFSAMIYEDGEMDYSPNSDPNEGWINLINRSGRTATVESEDVYVTLKQCESEISDFIMNSMKFFAPSAR